MSAITLRFHRPIHIGDLVEVEARLAYTGRTSMAIAVEVRSGDIKAGHFHRTTECLIVFAAVDAEGRTVEVDTWTPETPGEVALAARAKAQLDTARLSTHGGSG